MSSLLPLFDSTVANQDVLVTLPLSLIAIILLVFGLLIGVGCWLLTRHHHVSLPENTSWLSTVSQMLPCGFILINAEGQVALTNREARCWIGKFDHLADFPPDIQMVVHRAVSSGLHEEIAFNVGHRFWIEVAPLGERGDVLILTKEGHVGGVDAEVYRRLMQTIGHELRTPLTAIIGHADILSSCDIEEQALWRRSQQFITREADRLACLVDDLLTLSRLDQAASSPVPINLRVVAEEAISAMWQSAEESDIMLALQTCEGLPRVNGDPDRLRQVFVNLLDNGIKYTPSGGRVVLQLTCDDEEHVLIKVSDDGIGIPEADLPHIFDPLFRSDQATQIAPGTGLGLTIVHTILAQHGAEIVVQSEPQQAAPSLSISQLLFEIIGI